MNNFYGKLETGSQRGRGEMVGNGVAILDGIASKSAARMASFESSDLVELREDQLFDWYTTSRRYDAALACREKGFVAVPYIPPDDVPAAQKLSTAYDDINQQLSNLGNGFIDAVRRVWLQRRAGKPARELAKLCRIEQLGDYSAWRTQLADVRGAEDYLASRSAVTEAREFLRGWKLFLEIHTAAEDQSR